MPGVIALDAMGSDRAPKPEIEGAIQAARHYGARVLLVGREPQIRAELERHAAAAGLPLDIVHASEVIRMDGRDLLPQHLWHPAAAGRTALHRRGGRQRQRIDSPVVPASETTAAKFCGERGGSRRL